MTTQIDLATAYTIKVESPDGVMFVHCTERNDKLVHVLINIGKAGSAISAWADAMGRMITSALVHQPLSVIIDELSNITADRVTRTDSGIFVKSGPEAVFYALMIYNSHKTKLKKKISPAKRRYGFLPVRK